MAKGNGQRRIWLKRQRERIYLEHFLAILELRAEQVIEGRDDGNEPDFTVLIQGQWIGIELTTLPRLRDRLGDHWLILRHWYWRMIRWLGRPFTGTRRLQPSQLPISSTVDQEDVDAVMRKKASKVHGYHSRRTLHQLWLLIHTDRLQPDGLLGVPQHSLYHASDFDRVWMSFYPTRRLVAIEPVYCQRKKVSVSAKQ
ncbi:MAG: hypothetical protein VXW65_10990 [Pseudomonadota bacterium]|nr:hypothetical protein [Pseudomonadota bacterium]